MASVQNPVNPNPGTHSPGLLSGLATDAVAGAQNLAPGQHSAGGDLLSGTTGLVADTAQGATNLVGAGHPGGGPDLVRGAADLVGNTTQGATNLVGDTASDLAGGNRPGGRRRHGRWGHRRGRQHRAWRDEPRRRHRPRRHRRRRRRRAPGATNLVRGRRRRRAPRPPGDRPDLVGSDAGRHRPRARPPCSADDTPTPPTGQTVQAGFAGGLEASAAPANLPPAAAAPPLAGPGPAAPNLGGAPAFGGAPRRCAGSRADRRPRRPRWARRAGHRPQRRSAQQPAAARPTPAAYVPAQDPAPQRRPMAGPPGAPPPSRGEQDQALALFWPHVPDRPPARSRPTARHASSRRPRPSWTTPRASGSSRPTTPTSTSSTAPRASPSSAPRRPNARRRKRPPTPPPCRCRPRHPRRATRPSTAPSHRRARTSARRHRRSTTPPAADGDASAPTGRADSLRCRPARRPPHVAALMEAHDPLGGEHERDWDRRYLVRFGSVTAHGISQDGVEYAWPPGEQYPEGGSAHRRARGARRGTPCSTGSARRQGRVFAAGGTPFAQRSLPPAHRDAGLPRATGCRSRCRSGARCRPPGSRSPAAASATARRTPAAELVALGYLADITEEERMNAESITEWLAAVGVPGEVVSVGAEADNAWCLSATTPPPRTATRLGGLLARAGQPLRLGPLHQRAGRLPLPVRPPDLGPGRPRRGVTPA